MITEEQFEAVLLDIETTTKGLLHICKAHGTHKRALFEYLKANEEARNRYARAKEEQADLMVEEMISIADDSSNDTILTDKGEAENKEWVNRSKLRVDTRKWIASKLKPKKYGDKLDVTSDGERIQPITGMIIK
jgi:hypothetical protein